MVTSFITGSILSNTHQWGKLELTLKYSSRFFGPFFTWPCCRLCWLQVVTNQWQIDYLFVCVTEERQRIFNANSKNEVLLQSIKSQCDCGEKGMDDGVYKKRHQWNYKVCREILLFGKKSSNVKKHVQGNDNRLLFYRNTCNISTKWIMLLFQMHLVSLVT